MWVKNLINLPREILFLMAGRVASYGGSFDNYQVVLRRDTGEIEQEITDCIVLALTDGYKTSQKKLTYFFNSILISEMQDLFEAEQKNVLKKIPGIRSEYYKKIFLFGYVSAINISFGIAEIPDTVIYMIETACNVKLKRLDLEMVFMNNELKQQLMHTLMPEFLHPLLTEDYKRIYKFADREVYEI